MTAGTAVGGTTVKGKKADCGCQTGARHAEAETAASASLFDPVEPSSLTNASGLLLPRCVRLRDPTSKIAESRLDAYSGLLAT